MVCKMSGCAVRQCINLGGIAEVTDFCPLAWDKSLFLIIWAKLTYRRRKNNGKNTLPFLFK
ncbi:hypothetical protein CMETHOX_32750 [Lacrimispora indolis]|nr:hypothetical protein CMETHOX_32750 [[Clostridium] methoxybenzovorans]